MEDILKKVIGKTESDARKIAQESGYDSRVTVEDGIAYIVTADFRTDRVNFTLTKGIVTDASIH